MKGTQELLRELEKEHLKQDIPPFVVGDTISIHQRIVEGEKERVQVFSGTVIAFNQEHRLSANVWIHRVAHGEGVERLFWLHNPSIEKIEVIRKGDVCRSKLYYLRGRMGKSAKVKERLMGSKKSSSTNPAK